MGKQEKKNAGDSIIIPENIIERFVSLCERSAERSMEKSCVEVAKEDVIGNETDFIKGQLDRVKTQMEKCKDVASDEYRKYVKIYEDLVNIVRFW